LANTAVHPIQPINGVLSVGRTFP